MIGYIGLAGLIAIAAFLVLLFVRRKRIEKNLSAFYQKHALFIEPNQPPDVRQAIDGGNMQCLRGNLKLPSGEDIVFYWWEWLVRSTTYGSQGPRTSINYFLGISFPPNVLTEDFERLVESRLEENADFMQKLKNAFMLNTDAPVRIEKTADGSFVIIWQIIRKAEILEAKISWLKNNLILRNRPQIKNMEAF